MANIKIAQLTNQTAISDNDLIIVETATSTNKMTVGNLKELLGINGLLAASSDFKIETFNGDGAGAFKYSPCVYLFFAQDVGNPNAYIFGTGTKFNNVFTDGVHRLTVLHSSGLALGASNSQGTQVIIGAASNVIRLVVMSFPL